MLGAVMDMTISFIRTLLLYIGILAAVRFMGKRQISEMQTSELVVTLLISDIAAIPMQDSGQPLISGVLPILVLVVCELVTSALMVRHSRFRRVVCGKPAILIRDGVLQQKELKRLRLSVEDLFEQLREQGVFSFADVSYAILETDGRMSILKKPEQEPATPKLLGLRAPESGLEVVVISDGEVSDAALKLCGKDRKWLTNFLQQKKARQQDVFLLAVSTDGQTLLLPKEGTP